MKHPSKTVISRNDLKC